MLGQYFDDNDIESVRKALESSTISNDNALTIQVCQPTQPDAQIEALHEIIALHNQYTVAIMRHITDHSTDINEAITDIFTRKQTLNDAVDAYMNEYDIILEIEL
jgi:hypothetical protein